MSPNWGRLSYTQLKQWRTKRPLLFQLGLANLIGMLCSLCSFVLWILIISDHETPAPNQLDYRTFSTSRDTNNNREICTIVGGRTKEANERSFVFVHQHGRDDVT